jgi:hypothetical protein
MINTDISCTICLTDNINILNSYNTNCNHTFCKNCFTNWLNHQNYTCPICRTTIKEYKNENEINKLIYINTNNTNNRETVVSNLNQNLLYQNLRLKSCSIILFIFCIFSLNFFFITYMNYQYFFNKYRDYKNCTNYECDMNNKSVCYDI